ncbi:MAG: hypothetical protein NTV87_12905, partial [Ignavibacteriae bacterium]|nr:hypothetical protein [Ignavibacteriota bacterium]
MGSSGWPLLLRSHDNGNNWDVIFNQSSGGYGGYVKKVAVDNDGIIYAIADPNNSKLYRTIDSGVNWQFIKTFNYAPNHILINKYNHIFVAEYYGGSNYLSTNNGINWSSINSGFSGTFESITIDTNGYLFAVTQSEFFVSRHSTLSPFAPVPIQPAFGSDSLQLTPLLDWDSSAYAVNYRVQISTDSLFINVTHNQTDITQTQFTVPSGILTYNTKYFWRVNASNQYGEGFWSQVWNFTTIPLSLPNPPTLLIPQNNSTGISLIPLLDWNDVLTATDYHLQLSVDSNFVSNLLINDTAITSSQFQVSAGLLNNLTKYYWRVRAKNPAGWGDWSNPVFNFTTILSVPSSPVLLTPANNSANISLTPVLDWTDVTNASSYRVQVSTDSNFVNNLVINDSTLISSQYTVPQNKLIFLTKYYWRVNAKNFVGTGNWSNPNYSFTTLQNCIVTWQSNIVINDNNNARSDSLTIGTSAQATNGLDICLGEAQLPPIPPTGIFDIRFVLPVTNPLMDSKKDFRNDTVKNIIWKMKFQTSVSGYPVTLNWNNSALPQGSFYLKDEVTGTIVNVNMKAQNTCVLTNPGITSLKIEYAQTITVPVTVLSGWNIVSVPVLALDMSKTSLFPDAATPAYWFNNGYIANDTLKNGVGYFIRFNTGNTYNINGSIIT